MKKINIQRNFLIYIIFSIFFVIYFLYIKHSVGNDSSVSEWLINYQGGFTRRGMGGEIAINLASFFNLTLRKSILFIQILFHVSYLLLLFFYFRKIKLNILQLFALYAPIFLLYPIAEIEVLGRKEIILFLYFIIALFFSEKRYSTLIINIQTFIILPFVCLIWEEVVLFFPFIASVLIIKNNFNTFKQAFIKLLIIFLPSIITFGYIFMTPLSVEGHEIMCSFLKSEFNEVCYMSADMLISSTIYFDTLWIHQNANLEHYVRYLLIFLIGFLPLNILISNNDFLEKKNYLSKTFNLRTLFFILYSPSLLLFMFGYDWGRWINITYSFSILFYFYLIKNEIISNNLNLKNLLWNKILKRKILTSFLLVIFAFSWNPKTVITGDIASFPIYRIPYKMFKIVNN